jgi:hypothetical protein
MSDNGAARSRSEPEETGTQKQQQASITMQALARANGTSVVTRPSEPRKCLLDRSFGAGLYLRAREGARLGHGPIVNCA